MKNALTFVVIFMIGWGICVAVEAVFATSHIAFNMAVGYFFCTLGFAIADLFFPKPKLNEGQRKQENTK